MKCEFYIISYILTLTLFVESLQVSFEDVNVSVTFEAALIAVINVLPPTKKYKPHELSELLRKKNAK